MADRPKEDDVAPPRRESFEFEDNTKEDDSLMGRSVGVAGVSRSSLAKVTNSGPISVLAYCLSSISMTVVNKYVVSGTSWNLTFLYLAAQAIICVVAIGVGKQFGVIQNLATVDSSRVKKCKPSGLRGRVCDGGNRLLTTSMSRVSRVARLCRHDLHQH